MHIQIYKAEKKRVANKASELDTYQTVNVLDGLRYLLYWSYTCVLI